MTSIKRTALCIALFAASSSAAQAPDWTRAQPLAITLSSFKYSPAEITLHHGTAYRLHLQNTSSGGHDFVAKDLFAKSVIAPEDAGKIHGGGVDVDGGEAVDIRFVPQQPGTYKIHCSHFMHSTFGMTARVVVD
jgi:uncharacterized cupredoxin-like copper-binding protein